jgi:hypothetical protein
MVSFVLNETTEKELLDYYRISTRLDRALELVDFVEQVGIDCYLVQSASKPIRYVVDLQKMSCECPDWTYRGSVNGLPCKHIICAFLVAHRKEPRHQ